MVVAVEHCTGIAEVTGSNPVEDLNFSALSNYFNWKLTVKIDSHLNLHSQFTYESFQILHIISLLSWVAPNVWLNSSVGS